MLGTIFSLAREAVISSTCQPSATTLCLGGGRFAVSSRWQAPGVSPGEGQAQTVPTLASEQTGGRVAAPIAKAVIEAVLAHRGQEGGG